MAMPPDPRTRRGRGTYSPPLSQISTPHQRSPHDTAQHVDEADAKLEAAEAELARIVLGQSSVATLPSVIRLIQGSRWHLKAAA